MKLALLTCTDLPDWEVDDRFFHRALDEAGIEWSVYPWDGDVDWSSFDMVLIRTTWDYVTRRDDFIATLRHIANQTRLLNPFDVIAWNLEKTYLRDLEQMGLPIAPTVWITELIGLQDILTEKNWGRAFLKPVVGASAVNTKRFDLETVGSAQRWLENLLKQDERMMLQPYLNSVETEGEYSAIFFGRRLSHCVQKIPVPGDYRVQDDYGASDRYVDPTTLPALIQLANQTMEVLHSRFDGLIVARLDFLRMTTGEFVINEVELIEPSLFFRHSPVEAGRILVEELLSTFAAKTLLGNIDADQIGYDE